MLTLVALTIGTARCPGPFGAATPPAPDATRQTRHMRADGLDAWLRDLARTDAFPGVVRVTRAATWARMWA